MDERHRIAIIGYGAVARTLLFHLSERERESLCAILVRSPSDDHQPSLPIVSNLGALLEARPTLVVECAGHSAVQDYGPPVLAHGTDLIIISIGALANPDVQQRLEQASRAGGGKLIIPAGAVGGLDLLAAARVAGLDRVVYRSRKRPRSWEGSKAESLVSLQSVSGPTVFFRGDARAAAREFPQNANVAAAIALAGVGFERTEVELMADPDAPGNEHRIIAEGAFGRMEATIAGRPLAQNPRTSMLAALSLARAIRNRLSQMEI